MCESPYAEAIPRPWQAAASGRGNVGGAPNTFWFRTASVAYLHRFNKATEDELDLEGTKARLGWERRQYPNGGSGSGGGVIGVHIRHGDACHTTSRKGHCMGFSKYLPDLRAMKAKYNVTAVFIATDDERVIAEAKGHERKHPGEFRFLLDDKWSSVRKKLSSDEYIEDRPELWGPNSALGHAVAMSALADVALLAAADFLILHHMSNLSRLAHELAAAARGFLPPFISLDGAWCWHWRMRRGCEQDANGEAYFRKYVKPADGSKPKPAPGQKPKPKPKVAGGKKAEAEKGRRARSSASSSSRSSSRSSAWRPRRRGGGDGDGEKGKSRASSRG